jgi:hypothetical protein
MLRRSLLLVAACILPNLVSADPAVKSTNGSFGAGISTSRSTGDWSNQEEYSFSGDVILPLGEHFGLGLVADYATVPNSGCDLDGHSVGVQLFVRDPKLGRLGASYENGESQGCIPEPGGTFNFTLERDVYGIDAEYYLGPLTFTANRLRYTYEIGIVDIVSSVGAMWYPVENLSIGFSVGVQDTDDSYDFRTLSVVYQPESLGRTASISLDVRDHTDIDYEFVTVGFTYYFGDKVDLMTRDRSYR